jgi:ribosome-binding protein aMBF1 (putative translation factor)
MDMITTAEEFGNMVVGARKTLGITQRELALAINSGERFIVDLEAGKLTAQLGKALAAARAVGVRLENVAEQGK